MDKKFSLTISEEEFPVPRNTAAINKHIPGLDILLSLYYALIYPFLTYGIITWGDTYKTTLQPMFILQKRAMRLITLSLIHI